MKIDDPFDDPLSVLDKIEAAEDPDQLRIARRLDAPEEETDGAVELGALERDLRADREALRALHVEADDLLLAEIRRGVMQAATELATPVASRPPAGRRLGARAAVLAAGVGAFLAWQSSRLPSSPPPSPTVDGPAVVRVEAGSRWVPTEEPAQTDNLPFLGPFVEPSADERIADSAAIPIDSAATGNEDAAPAPSAEPLVAHKPDRRVTWITDDPNLVIHWLVDDAAADTPTSASETD